MAKTKKPCGTCGKTECAHIGFARLTPEQRQRRGKRGGKIAQAKWDSDDEMERLPHRFTSKTARIARQIREEQKEPN